MVRGFCARCGGSLAPALALLAHHVAVVAWGMAPWPELDAAADFLAVTMAVIVVVLLRRWCKTWLALPLAETSRNLLALAVALTVMLANVMLAVISMNILEWLRVS